MGDFSSLHKVFFIVLSKNTATNPKGGDSTVYVHVILDTRFEHKLDIVLTSKGTSEYEPGKFRRILGTETAGHFLSKLASGMLQLKEETGEEVPYLDAMKQSIDPRSDGGSPQIVVLRHLIWRTGYPRETAQAISDDIEALRRRVSTHFEKSAAA